MKYILFFCAVLAAQPILAARIEAPSPRASFGSARTVADIQTCLALKLGYLGAAVVSSVPPTTRLAYGQDKDELIVELTDNGDVRLVTVDAVRKLGSRQDEFGLACINHGQFWGSLCAVTAENGLALIAGASMR